MLDEVWSLERASATLLVSWKPYVLDVINYDANFLALTRRMDDSVGFIESGNFDLLSHLAAIVLSVCARMQSKCWIEF